MIPALEPDRELHRCIDSVHLALAGTGRYEILVVMPPRAVAAATAMFHDVRVEPERRRGIYAAMNDGAAASQGRYLLFLGKDDILLPTIREVAVLAGAGPAAVSCDVYWGDRGVYSGRPSRWRLLTRNICHQGVVYARAAFDRHGPYLRRMRVQADHLFNIRLLWDRSPMTGGIRYLPKPLVWYSGSGFSNTQRDPLFRRLYPGVIRRYVGRWAACALLLSRALRARP